MYLSKKVAVLFSAISQLTHKEFVTEQKHQNQHFLTQILTLILFSSFRRHINKVTINRADYMQLQLVYEPKDCALRSWEYGTCFEADMELYEHRDNEPNTCATTKAQMEFEIKNSGTGISGAH